MVFGWHESSLDLRCGLEIVGELESGRVAGAATADPRTGRCLNDGDRGVGASPAAPFASSARTSPIARPPDRGADPGSPRRSSPARASAAGASRRKQLAAAGRGSYGGLIARRFTHEETTMNTASPPPDRPGQRGLLHRRDPPRHRCAGLGRRHRPRRRRRADRTPAASAPRV
ncbi:MAG: hypothetical protein MZW92_69535 [Comamonadaceae bacterium]|nr:hypothetical protein [Comamonadaceae bacterium]